MTVMKFAFLATLLAIAAFWARPSMAQSSHSEEFTEAADDTFEPETRDPMGEGDFGGSPPVDWNDIRTAWSGTIEENNSPLGDALSYPPIDPGASTPEYGIVQWESGVGPYWSPSTFDSGFASISYSLDIWADPTIVEGPGGQPDLPWWHSEISVTGSGMTATVNGPGPPGGASTDWTFTTTAGNFIATVPVSEWYEMDVTFQQGGSGTLEIVHTLYDATGTIPFGSYTTTGAALYLGPHLNQPIDVAYSWLGNGNNTGVFDVGFVDDFSVETTPIPEPSSLVLLGMGAIGMVAAYRRRRRTA